MTSSPAGPLAHSQAGCLDIVLHANHMRPQGLCTSYYFALGASTPDISTLILFTPSDLPQAL